MQLLFGDHVWFRHKATGRFYDPSYGKTFATKKESTLNNYCNQMLDGICFTGKGLLSMYIRHYEIRPLIDSNINYQVVTKDAYAYLHVTKGDI